VVAIAANQHRKASGESSDGAKSNTFGGATISRTGAGPRPSSLWQWPVTASRLPAVHGRGGSCVWKQPKSFALWLRRSRPTWSNRCGTARPARTGSTRSARYLPANARSSGHAGTVNFLPVGSNVDGSYGARTSMHGSTVTKRARDQRYRAISRHSPNIPLSRHRSHHESALLPSSTRCIRSGNRVLTSRELGRYNV
jgi:hypothetical protein